MQEKIPEKNELAANTDPLSIPLAQLELSVRTANVLKNAEIVFLGDLISWTEAALMGLQNCGRKSVQELKDVLSAYGLHLGVSKDWTPPEEVAETSNTLDDYNEEARAKLLLRISELRLSARANNALTLASIEFVGELVGKTAAQLRRLKNCGRITATEIKDRIEGLGLSLGTEIANWNRKYAEQERAQPGKALNAALETVMSTFVPLIDASCLEEELRGILLEFSNDRNAEIVSKLLGCSGHGSRTLESVAQEFGITRERVRQIAAKTTGKLTKNKIETPYLLRAIKALQQVGPATPKELAMLLHKAGITRSNFNVSGVTATCDALDIKYDLETQIIGNRLIYGKKAALERLHSLPVLCRKLTTAKGCVNFDAMCDELNMPENERVGARALISKIGSNIWLDEDHHWLFAKDVTRNRLTNIVSKILSVSPKIHLSELRRASTRSRRLQIVPPSKVLAKFLEKNGLAFVSGDDVVSERNFENAIEPGSSEETMVRILKTYGPVLAWNKFQELCISEGMNPTTAVIYMSNSPVVSRILHGVYSLVGTKIAPGVAEEIASQLGRARRPADFGWTSRNTLWCAIPVNRNTVTSGSVHLPSFVMNLIEGKEWRIQFGGKFSGAILKARNNFVWSLAKPLSNNGAEPGDVCVLDFDLTTQTVDLTIGGEDLVDAWESGNIDLLRNNDNENTELEKLKAVS